MKKTAKNRKIFSAKNAEIHKICADTAQKSAFLVISAKLPTILSFL